MLTLCEYTSALHPCFSPTIKHDHFWTNMTVSSDGCAVQHLPPVEHNLQTIDVQPVAEGATLVLVTGQLQVEGSDNALGFTELFQVVAEGEGYYVHNHFISLNYA